MHLPARIAMLAAVLVATLTALLLMLAWAQLTVPSRLACAGVTASVGVGYAIHRTRQHHRR